MIKITIFVTAFLLTGTLLYGQFNCGDVLVDPRDSKQYNTVLIGNQCWMAENLNYGTKITPPADMSDDGIVHKYCYNDNSSNCDEYGGLYKWSEMMDYSPSDNGLAGTTQGICPEGWHIPTDEEWKTLEMTLGMTQAQADASEWRGTDQGTRLKVGGSSGFNALLAGAYSNNHFSSMGTLGTIWTATETYNAWYRGVSESSAKVHRHAYSGSTYGYSVRCACDDYGSIDSHILPELKISDPYPNPANNYVTFKYYLPVNNNGSIVFYDIFGKEILCQEIIGSDNSIKIPLENIHSGTYYYYLMTQNGISIGKKLVIIR